MAYEGELLTSCGKLKFDFSETYVVAVSGSGPNVCGHAILFSAKTSTFFHVAGIYGEPRYMSLAGYKRYLKENKKTEIRRLLVSMPNPEGVEIYMERLLAEKWAWGVLPHNCVSFVEDVIKAGGGDFASMTNCPVVATAKPLKDRIAEYMQFLGGSVYNQYTTPPAASPFSR